MAIGAQKKKKPKFTAGTAKLVDLKHFGDEPIYKGIGEMSKIEMMKFCNYYNYIMSRGEGTEFLVTYLDTVRPDLSKKVRHIDERLIPTSICWIARMVMRGIPLPDDAIAKIVAQVEPVVDRYYVVETEKKTNDVVISLVDKAREKENNIIGDIEEMLDRGGAFSVYDYLTSNSVPKHYANRIMSYYGPVLEEVLEAYERPDRDLKEAYSTYSRKELRQLVEHFKKILADADRYAENKKVERKARKPKPVSVEKKVANVQYMPRFDDYQLVSKQPSCILGAKELWVYDARYKDVYRYVSDTGLDVRGTTILNFDEAASVKKSCGRTSKEVVDRVLKEGKVGIKKLMDTIKSPVQTPIGRLNKNMLILRSA